MMRNRYFSEKNACFSLLSMIESQNASENSAILIMTIAKQKQSTKRLFLRPNASLAATDFQSFARCSLKRIYGKTAVLFC